MFNIYSFAFFNRLMSESYKTIQITKIQILIKSLMDHIFKKKKGSNVGLLITTSKIVLI